MVDVDYISVCSIAMQCCSCTFLQGEIKMDELYTSAARENSLCVMQYMAEAASTVHKNSYYTMLVEM